jgi:hypothetical protein
MSAQTYIMFSPVSYHISPTVGLEGAVVDLITKSIPVRLAPLIAGRVPVKVAALIPKEST